MTIVTFATSVDEDQVAQKIQPDLRYILSTLINYVRKKSAMKVQLFWSHF